MCWRIYCWLVFCSFKTVICSVLNSGMNFNLWKGRVSDLPPKNWSKRAPIFLPDCAVSKIKNHLKNNFQVSGVRFFTIFCSILFWFKRHASEKVLAINRHELHEAQAAVSFPRPSSHLLGRSGSLMSGLPMEKKDTSPSPRIFSIVSMFLLPPTSMTGTGRFRFFT